MEACLAGETVTFTGRLVSLTKAQAAELVVQSGGECVPSVTKYTTLLVIGQEGWPLKRDGRLTRKLRRARALIDAGLPLKVLTEEDLLRRLNLRSQLDQVSRLFSLGELNGMLNAPPDRLRAWVQAGLLIPAHEVKGVAYFDFRQANRARTLAELAGRGVTIDQLKRSFQELRSWMAEADHALALLERDGRLLVRLRDDLLAEPAGQLCWDFSDDACITVALDESKPTQQEWFEIGWSHEQAERFHDAIHAYRQALLADKPDAHICLNLANVLYADSQCDAAVERYWQAVELEPTWAEAWNNLGVALADCEEYDEAIAAYERSIQLNPTYADPHYNLADLLTRLRRKKSASILWRRYLELDPLSEWADYARKQIASYSA
jgi:tetratricopeptide (TPR) repeat protein